MELNTKDEDDILREKIVEYFGKYHRNVQQMTKEQREKYKQPLSKLLMQANECLRKYVQNVVVVDSHATLEDVNKLISVHPDMSKKIKEFVKAGDFDGLDEFLFSLNGEINISRMERELAQNQQN